MQANAETKTDPQSPPEEAGKIRKNVMLTEDVVVRGKTLAKLDSRNFSTELEALINQEYERRFPDRVNGNGNGSNSH